MDRRTFVFASAALAWAPSAWAAAARLDGPRKAPAVAPARFLVVLLHGFGSDGADLFGLTPSFQPYVPSAAFVAPNAPFRMDGGYSWSDPRQRGRGGDRGPEAVSDGPVVADFLDRELARHGLAPDKLILIGFSQGASLALNVGLRRATPPAAIVAYSGANLAAEGLRAGAPRPPVLLIQGDEDPRVRPEGQKEAMRILKAIGARCEAHILPGLGHGIDDRGIKLGGELIRSVTRSAGGS